MNGLAGRGRRRHLVAREDRARRAADRLGRGTERQRVERHIAEHLKEGLTATATNGERQNGDALEAIAGAAKKVEAVYGTPFLAHACMETMNRTVRLIGQTRRRSGSRRQNAEASLAALSEASGLPLAKCEVYRHDLGGGFGRRGGTQDYVRQAAAIAKEFPGMPIKLIWSREEDQAHDFFRPISQCKLSAGLDAAGNLVGLHVRVVRASRSTPPSIRPASATGRTAASCRASGSSRATRSSATPCRTC